MNPILLLLDHRANRHMLAKVLHPQFPVQEPVGDELPDGPFELVIVDGRALKRLGPQIETLRESVQPVFLPVILVTTREDARLVTGQVWQWIDDMLIAPIERKELFARVHVLLRARNFSVRLAESNAELRKLDTIKDQFLSIISHELRTPINAISGFGSVLDDGVAGELTEQQHLYVRRMLGSADDLLALVDELLEMSRIQAGHLALDLGPMDLASEVKEAVTRLATLADRKHQHLSWMAPEGLPQLTGDSRRIRQVLVNLINNAIKFTPDGGTIEVKVMQDDGWIRCEVKDTGVGIAPGDQERIFQRFTQVDTSYTREKGGTGLGLAISKALIEAHGGRIGVQSKPRKGSIFWFTLPGGKPSGRRRVKA